MGSVSRRSDAYEEDFWEANDLASVKSTKGDVPPARVAAAGLDEWKRSVAAKVKDRDGLRQRLAGAMDSAVANEADRLSNRLNFLATVGSVAPFVGLFGTVWGIMNSFFQIGQQQNSSLAVVAPGISEALFATAIGLFAAIPAVIAYNRFSHRVNSFEARLQRFADRFLANLSRELDAG
jgi:biopolymer transport protein TolQ